MAIVGVLVSRHSQDLLNVVSRNGRTPQDLTKLSVIPIDLLLIYIPRQCRQGIFQDLEHGGVNQPLGALLLSPSLSLSFPSLPPFPLPPLEVGPLNPARGSGERFKLPQRGLGRSPSQN